MRKSKKLLLNIVISLILIFGPIGLSLDGSLFGQYINGLVDYCVVSIETGDIHL